MLTSLRRIVLEFSQNTELESALRRIVSQIKQVMKTQCCSIYLADHQKQHFILMASDGLDEKSLGQTTIGFTEGLIGLVAQREEPLNIANARSHPHFIHAPEVKEENLNAFLGTPIIHQRKVIGVISIQQEKARFFNENEEAFLVTLAAQIATAMANAEATGLIAQHQGNNHWTKAIQGAAGSSGVAVAPMLLVQPHADLTAIALTKTQDVALEREKFEQAVNQTREDYTQMASKLEAIIVDNSLDIFEMYKQLLDNANLGREVADKINERWNAESALKIIIDSYVVQFESLEDSYLRERASDIKDLGNRLLFNIQSFSKIPKAVPEEFILVAEDVTASMVAEYQHQGLKGIVSLQGSNNSHAAILARALALPAVMGIERIPLGKLDKHLCIIDGYSGELFVDPNEALIREYEHLIAEESALADKVKQVQLLPAITPDGKEIELLLNAGLSSGFEHSKNSGAAGIGLYRTEIPFMSKSCFPSELEQTVLYRQVLEAFPQQPVTMRTLDVGGDKSLPYFPIHEENPFLGWRGIRITLDHPEIFLLQIRAMIRASVAYQNLEIMLPMISSVAEVDEAIRLINQAYFELSSELATDQNTVLARPRIGIMIEVPSVIFQLEELAKKVDFFSVGSNDLTQYLLAVDRNNSRVASIYSSYHPAVLKALQMIAQESKKYAVPLSLCGELASEPAGALLLLAMGYDKLSMNPHNISRIKWVIRHVEFKKAQSILAKVLTLSNAKQVHNYLNEQLELLELGGFVRAGM
ncbi:MULTISPECIES: phosphoenolpyruvate--protein phosphotransferase [Thalassotalea]|uniref:phosphoenolpyruvate--protein phosphotransferase n=1 Tax=Thalassotalea castellviae TaxID=3075612 RepID=A0ABU2ZZN8_9GAMM|nr:phosphoenolpyruvate--protein phosphotransferase [Thalassotalea sp. W431]MDT0602975.1 phosphoenolpyruvate--protein phosphotransferase [Thalassotalea sp. W431]